MVFNKITPQKQTIEINLEPFQGVMINQISMSKNNFSTSTHIVEMQYGPNFEEKSVIARLKGNVCETQLVQLDVPAQQKEQNICFLLIGDDDKIGDVDIIYQIYVDQNLFQLVMGNENQEGYEEYEDEEEQDNEQNNQQQKQDKQNNQQNNQQKQQQNNDDNDDVIKMISEQRKNIENEQKTQVKKEIQEKEKHKQNQWRLYKGMKILDKVVGKGEPCKVGQTVSVRYVLHLEDENGKIIDQSGNGDVIRGWELGIPGMKINGIRQLIIPPHLGYGNQGTDGIPPRTNLFFEVQLVNKRD